jgi:hypothetical protein
MDIYGNRTDRFSRNMEELQPNLGRTTIETPATSTKADPFIQRIGVLFVWRENARAFQIEQLLLLQVQKQNRHRRLGDDFPRTTKNIPLLSRRGH